MLTLHAEVGNEYMLTAFRVLGLYEHEVTDEACAEAGRESYLHEQHLSSSASPPHLSQDLAGTCRSITRSQKHEAQALVHTYWMLHTN